MIAECRKRMYNNQLKENGNQQQFNGPSGNEKGLPRSDAARKTTPSRPVMHILPEQRDIREAESAAEFGWPM